MKTANTVLLREQLLSPNINLLQYMSCYECHENKKETINTIKPPNLNKQQKTTHAQQGYNYHQNTVRDSFLLGI